MLHVIEKSSQNLFSIGTLSERVGVPVPTLRTWERRYGFPVSRRIPSGHRRYDDAEAARLTLRIRAMKAGARPGAVAVLRDDELRALAPQSHAAAPPTGPSDGHTSAWLPAVRDLDVDALDAALRAAWARHGSVALTLRLIPEFLHQIGDAWADGTLTVAQEHFASEHLVGFLSELWRPHRPEPTAPLILVTTLPGEHHYLSLHLIAVLAAAAGLRVLFLGRDTPLASVAQAAIRTGPAMVCVSVSQASQPGVCRALLAELRRLLPPDLEVLAGGAGAIRLGDVAGVARPGGLAALWELLSEISPARLA